MGNEIVFDALIRLTQLNLRVRKLTLLFTWAFASLEFCAEGGFIPCNIDDLHLLDTRAKWRRPLALKLLKAVVSSIACSKLFNGRVMMAGLCICFFLAWDFKRFCL